MWFIVIRDDVIIQYTFYLGKRTLLCSEGSNLHKKIKGFRGKFIKLYNIRLITFYFKN